MRVRTIRTALVSLTAGALLAAGLGGLSPALLASAATMPAVSPATMPAVSPAISPAVVRAAFTDVVKTKPLLGWVPNNGVHALARDASWIYLGGTFTSLTNPTTESTVNAAGLVRLSISTGNPDTTWKPTVNGDVLTMVIVGSTLFLGGDFTTVDGKSRARLGAVSTSGAGALSSWYPGAADKQVKTLISLDSSTLLAGGGFLHIGSAKRTHLAKISTGGVLSSFAPSINGTVYTAGHVSGSAFVYLGGLFTTLGSATRKYIGALNTSTGVATSWNPGSPCGSSPKACPVFAFVPTAGAIYAGAGGENPSGSAISYNPTTGARNWTVSGDGDVQALTLIGGELFVGGHFGPSFGGATRTNLAGVVASTGALAGFNPVVKNLFPGTAAMISLPNGSLAIGGDETNIGGTADARYAVFPPA